MDSTLKAVKALLPGVYQQSKFNGDDLLAILEGITGFLSAVQGRDPSATLAAAIGMANHFTSKCNAGSLQSYFNNIDKWMKFGKAYVALNDSSDLDFDTMDVETVPEMMKVIYVSSQL